MPLLAGQTGGAANWLSGDDATFDASSGHWTGAGNCTAARTTAQTHAGAGAYRMTSQAAGNMNTASCLAANITTLGLPCSENDQISTGVWFKAVTDGRTVRASAQFYTSAGVWISTAPGTDFTDTTSGWTHVTAIVTAPATAAYCRLFPVVAGTAGAGEQHDIDDAYLANLTTGGVITQVAQYVGCSAPRGTWSTMNSTVGPSATWLLFVPSDTTLPAEFDADGTPNDVLLVQCYKGSSVSQAQLENYIAGIPTGRNVILIYHQEPEGDYSAGSVFNSEFKTQSDRIRAAAAARGKSSQVKVATASASYPYRNDGSADVLSGNYLKDLGSVSAVSGQPYADYFFFDVYQGAGGYSVDGNWAWPKTNLGDYDRWLNWLKVVTTPATVGHLRPLGIKEYGIVGTEYAPDIPGVSDSRRHDRIQADHDYLVEAFTPGGPNAVSPYPLFCWMYWWWDKGVSDPNPDDDFTDAATIALWQSYEAGTPPPVPPSVYAHPPVSAGEGQPFAPLITPPPPPPPPPPPGWLPTARSDWHWIIGPTAGGYTFELPQTTGRQVTWRLTDAHDATFTVNASAGYDSGVAPLATDLHIVRGGQELFRGRVMSPSDSFSAGVHQATFTAMSYRGILDRRILYSADLPSGGTWTGIDVGMIAWKLIDATQANPGGDLGITRGWAGDAPTGQAGDKSVAAGDVVGEKIDDLAYVDQPADSGNPAITGFDWDIVPDGQSSLQLQLWPVSRGTDQGIIFTYGDTLTGSDWTRDVDTSTYADAIRLTGTYASIELDAAGIALSPYGRWDAVLSCDEADSTRLKARAYLLLTSAQLLPASWSVPLRPGVWQGPSHIWVGDTVRVRPTTGRLAGTEETLRVVELSAELSQDGEKVMLTLGAPRPNLPAQLRRILRELRKSRKQRMTGQAPYPGWHQVI